MKYLTLDEVAEELETTRDKILKLITGEEEDADGGMLLFPTVYFSEPVQVQRRIDGPEWIEESVAGYLEINGLYDTERDFLGYWRLSFGGKSRVMLSKDGTQYILAQEKRVRESDLLVSDEELAHWKEMRGISDKRDVAPSEEPTAEFERVKTPVTEQESQDNVTEHTVTNQEKQSIEEFIEFHRKAEEPDAIIAAKLHNEYDLEDHKIAVALGLDVGYNADQYATVKQAGRRMRLKGKKLLAKKEETAKP
ncbi:MAG: hypothetical protein EG828_15000 [Deltaproteobacteria bacterium]|nr:hypothetical protein [Deltaproteobacteria bacterium]